MAGFLLLFALTGPGATGAGLEPPITMRIYDIRPRLWQLHGPECPCCFTEERILRLVGQTRAANAPRSRGEAFIARGLLIVTDAQDVHENLARALEDLRR